MKCVFILPNLGAGGAERVVTLLSREFISLSIEVDIVLMLDDLVQYNVPSGVNVVFLNSEYNSKKERVIKLRNYFKNVLKKKDKIVAIPFHDSCLKTALIATFGIKIEIVACERNNPYIKGKTLYSKIVANLPYLLANKCIFQTKDALEYYCDIVKNKSIVIENPIKTNEEYCWTKNESKRIISIGRLQEQKNHELLIDAFKKIYEWNPNYRLDIYGEGPLKEKLLTKIELNNLTGIINLKGHTKNVYTELITSEFFVLTSNYEGMSNALIEAMSIGMPVISTDHPIGGARALIRNGENGLLIEVNNQQELVFAMKKLIINQEFACKLGNNAKKITERLSCKEIAKKWISFLHS